MSDRPGSSPAPGLLWASWLMIAIPFVAALALLGSSFSRISHQDYSTRAGRLTAVRVWSDDPNCLQMDLDLDNGEFVSIDDCGAAPPYVLNPRPAPSDFAVGDHVTAINYAGSATDVILDHNGTETHYTSAYYQASGAKSASHQQTDLASNLTAAVIAIAFWVVLALGRAVWLARVWGRTVGAASFLAATTFTPYLGLAGLGGASGGTSGSDSAVFGALVAASLVGLVSAISVWAIYSASKRSEVVKGGRDEIHRLGILTLVGAAGWLLWIGWLLVSLSLIGASCCG